MLVECIYNLIINLFMFSYLFQPIPNAQSQTNEMVLMTCNCVTFYSKQRADSRCVVLIEMQK